ncbi:DUF2911 domain-containing protein [Formosa sp. A9]|uniref:DUF2911 domain-containing protein n=1 Tax=Formosa sp. A9 TaxID=3442641 RepID=UPI003EBAD52B
MKLFKVSTFFVALAFSLCTAVQAQEFKGLDKSPMDAAAYPASYKEANKAIKVVYSRPQLNERSLEQLAPQGKVWRTGANEIPEITFYKPVVFGDKTIKPGSYALFTIPGEKTWTVILSSDVNAWGAYSYNEANDVARANGIVSTDSEPIEAFSIAFTGDDKNATMHLAWGTTRVQVPFKL